MTLRTPSSVSKLGFQDILSLEVNHHLGLPQFHNFRTFGFFALLERLEGSGILKIFKNGGYFLFG